VPVVTPQNFDTVPILNFLLTPFFCHATGSTHRIRHSRRTYIAGTLNPDPYKLDPLALLSKLCCLFVFSVYLALLSEIEVRGLRWRVQLSDSNP